MSGQNNASDDSGFNWGLIGLIVVVALVLLAYFTDIGPDIL